MKQTTMNFGFILVALLAFSATNKSAQQKVLVDTSILTTSDTTVRSKRKSAKRKPAELGNVSVGCQTDMMQRFIPTNFEIISEEIKHMQEKYASLEQRYNALFALVVTNQNFAALVAGRVGALEQGQKNIEEKLNEFIVRHRAKVARIERQMQATDVYIRELYRLNNQLERNLNQLRGPMAGPMAGPLAAVQGQMAAAQQP